MDSPGIWIKVEHGFVTSVQTNSAHLANLQADVTVTYGDADARAFPMRQMQHADEIAQYVASRRAGVLHTQEHGLGIVCEAASERCRALAGIYQQAAERFCALSRAPIEGDPHALLEQIETEIAQLDPNAMHELIQQLRSRCQIAMRCAPNADHDSGAAHHAQPRLACVR